MSNIWFSSDFHYNHKNLVKGVTSWEDPSKCRNFKTLEHHDTTLVNNINSCVMSNDVLYFTGDWSFGGTENVIKFRERINCNNIHLILGNHDKYIRQKQVELLKSKVFLTISEKKEIEISKQLIILDHYAHRVWNQCHKGSWMLHGHSHGSLPHYGDNNSLKIMGMPIIKSNLFKTMDIGIDCHPKFEPFSFESIEKIMKKRINLSGLDHHNPKIRE